MNDDILPNRSTFPTNHADLVMNAIAYARWLAQRDGKDVSRANYSNPVLCYRSFRKKNNRIGFGLWRVRAVRFERISMNIWGEPRRAHDPKYQEPEIVAEIKIPHWDWVPTVVHEIEGE